MKIKSRLLMAFLLFIIIIESVFLVFFLNTQKQKFEKKIYTIEIEKEQILSDKNLIESKLKNMYYKYDTLQTNNDSLTSILNNEKNKIIFLLKKLNLITKNITNIHEYDSIKLQIISIQQDIDQYTSEIAKLNTNLKDVKNENYILKNKINNAKDITISDININAYNKKGKIINSANRLNKISIEFSINKNIFVDKKKIEIYIRINNPNGYVFVDENSDMFYFNGKEIIYSSKDFIEYKNEKITFKKDWIIDNDVVGDEKYTNIPGDNNKNSNISGQYSIDIFIDKKHVAEKYFFLK